MAWTKAHFRLTSACPLLMKNGQTADPRNKFAKASKEISSKRKKVDADHEELQRIDFLGALYMGPNGPCIPGRVVEGAIINGAKKEKSGPQAKCGLYCSGSFDLQYDGPRDAEGLYEDDRFRDVQPVRVGQAKVMRCRPVFDSWAMEIEINYDDETINLASLERWVAIAGMQIGIGDFRPRHGRFNSELIERPALTAKVVEPKKLAAV